MATGNQPARSFELRQILFPFGAFGLYFISQRPQGLLRIGLVLALLAFRSSMFALLYPLVPGSVIPPEEQFILPYSLFVLLGGVGGFLGLALIATAFWQAGGSLGRQRAIPLIVALLPLPLL